MSGSTVTVTVTDEARLEAVVLLQRYAIELEAVAASTMGHAPTGSVDLQILLAVAPHGAGPSALVERLGLARSTLARGISRLRRAGLAERCVDVLDRRRAVIVPSTSGQARVVRFEHALEDFLADAAALVKEVMLLLGRDPESTPPPPDPRGARESAERIRRAGASYVRDVREAVAPFGVSETADRYAVVYLALGEGRPSQLAEYLHLSPAGTTSLLDRLEAQGLVVRRSGGLESDHRAVLVGLTPAGRRTADAVLEVFVQHERALLEALAASTHVRP